MIKQGNNGSFAQVEIREAFLFTEFGESYARRMFGNEIVDALPRYTKGNHKGQLKGKIVWRKVAKGGWISGVGVTGLGKTFAHGIWDTPFGQEPTLLHGYDAYDRDWAKVALKREQPSVEQPVQETNEQERKYLLDTIAMFREQGNTLAAEMIEKTLLK